MHSTSAPLLISLADNVHAISKSPLNLLDAKDTAPTSDAENEQHDNDFSCLYHFFYYKIITFFSEVVFSLDSNDSSHNKNNEVNNQHLTLQLSFLNIKLYYLDEQRFKPAANANHNNDRRRVGRRAEDKKLQTRQTKQHNDDRNESINADNTIHRH